jgi:predicted TIM-barrel fold metal-dependent hydrolase
MRARDNLLANHTDLRVIGAHLGSMEHDLDLVAQHLDRFPNFHVDVAARTPVLKRLPIEQVRQFFIKYQNRILYGTDTEDDGTRTNEKAFTEAVEHSYRADFHYYAETLNLPREVLQKFYSGNAERLWGKRISE